MKPFVPPTLITEATIALGMAARGCQGGSGWLGLNTAEPSARHDVDIQVVPPR